MFILVYLSDRSFSSNMPIDLSIISVITYLCDLLRSISLNITVYTYISYHIPMAESNY